MLKPAMTALIASTLTACASGPPPQPAGLPPPHLIQPCPPTLPTPDRPTGPEILRAWVQAAEMYHDCRVRHEGLAGWATKD
jgi:hypothetical protein